MGAARYIGRVGGLAVALGVGSAIASGHGIAAAETTDSQPGNSANSEQSSTEPSGGSGTGAATSATGVTTGSSRTSTETETETETETDTDGPSDADADESKNSTTTTTVTGGVTVSAQTNTGSAPDAKAPEVTVAAETTATPDEPKPEPEPEPTATTEPEPTRTPTAEPTATPTAEPTVTPTAEPAKNSVETAARKPDSSPSSQSKPDGAATAAIEQPSASATARTVQSVSNPAAAVQEPTRFAVFADARSLAATTDDVSSTMAAFQPTSATTPTAPPNLFTTVANVVSSAINWVLNPLAGTAPTTPAQPPLIWGLLAFARREFENLFSALTGRPTPTATTLVEPATRLALAAAAAPAGPLYSPFPNPQVSPSTQFVSWVTGAYKYPNDPLSGYSDLMANTVDRYRVGGTDLGIMWDNGIPDDPNTPINEHQILIAVGDTFADGNMSVDWRSNTIFRSSDWDLANGIEIPNGQWYTGNMFGGAPLGPDGNPNRARQVIFAEGLPAGVTLIPTAGISVPTPGSRFGAIQYVSFMSVSQWGSPGSWTTNYSAIAWSDDNGETFHVAPQTVRYNQPWSGNQNFQQSAFVRPGDGYVYMYGTPNGRQGAAYLSRVPEQDILDLTKYEYWNGGNAGFFGWGATPAGWRKNDPAAATAVFGVDQGACGVANPGNQVSEMSVQYNKQLNKYVVLHGDQFNNIVMRTSDTPQGTWSSAKVLMSQQPGGIYAPMMHPWSPSTQGTGTDLYWNLSLWDDYNVMLMRTDLSKV
ncbi:MULTISPECIES: DUF4185 domain-containing protein [unclassified Mycobacterium]|uniref:DUF4185 domain-containing protein n=1 Tax=unclassified Mycobacterium TaxID=2642494 RepID=UPI0007401838|nr:MULTISPECIES: DUF4185 domain-containing protein [unclassified Mycobacterium]KUH80503.1 hypothetical protein AU186_14010 [Mycobacterium sp. GA-1999]KUH89193.1 hypothetical protein AU185_24330 [Mycobacterium sp. GA-0227b]KUH95928.1 hypothetical protein AU187_21065 [Mycobacterium sp. IS-1556]